MPLEEIKAIGAFILKAGQRLRHLLENLILLGELQFLMKDQKIIAAMRRETRTPVREVIQAVAEQEVNNQKRADSMEINVSESVVQISSTHLAKIIEEIIDNALKFSAPGTKISVSSDDTNDRIMITIRDEGRGMTQEQIGRITAFQQFERRHYEQQGAGLGLVIAKTLVELYGGSLAIESEENKGTTVTLLLPGEKGEG